VGDTDRADPDPPRSGDPTEALDALVPGLSDALIDLLDALHDRTDDLGPADATVLGLVASHLARTWASTIPAERPIALLDALRAVLKPARAESGAYP
jgi:hypothetical protein